MSLATTLQQMDFPSAIELVEASGRTLLGKAIQAKAGEAVKAAGKALARAEYMRREEDSLSQYWRGVELAAAADDIQAAAFAFAEVESEAACA